MKKTIFFLLVVAPAALHAQPTTAIQPTTTTQPTTAKDFAGYANDSHSLMVTAYQQRDIPRYRQLLNEFLDRYEHLDSAGRQYYVTYCIDAYYNLACTYSLLHQYGAALGYASRFITCQPKDSLHHDPDCHVIDMVYIPSLFWTAPH